MKFITKINKKTIKLKEILYLKINKDIRHTSTYKLIIKKIFYIFIILCTYKKLY